MLACGRVSEWMIVAAAKCMEHLKAMPQPYIIIFTRSIAGVSVPLPTRECACARTQAARTHMLLAYSSNFTCLLYNKTSSVDANFQCFKTIANDFTSTQYNGVEYKTSHCYDAYHMWRDFRRIRRLQQVVVHDDNVDNIVLVVSFTPFSPDDRINAASADDVSITVHDNWTSNDVNLFITTSIYRHSSNNVASKRSEWWNYGTYCFSDR